MVLWALDEDITVGTSATAFSPDAVLTRAQIVTFPLSTEKYTPALPAQRQILTTCMEAPDLQGGHRALRGHSQVGGGDGAHELLSVVMPFFPVSAGIVRPGGRPWPVPGRRASL